MSSGASAKQVYRVTIFNQTLSIASSTSAAEFEHIADQVDVLMSKIASKSGIADGTRVGVLAAMHLADHLHQTERWLAAAQDALEASRAECNSLNAQLGAARVAGASAGNSLELAKEQAAAAERARAALEEELKLVKNALAAAQAELLAQRSRIGKDAGRLHSLLEQALEAPEDESGTAPSLFPVEGARAASNSAGS